MSSGLGSSLPVVVTPRSVPSNFQVPNDVQGVLEAIAQYTDYETPIAGPAIVISPTEVETEPDTGAQIGADPNGLFIWSLGPSSINQPLAPRPMAWYRNSWWQVYSGRPGEIRMFAGYPGNYFDGSGLGLDWGGWEGWALCNGLNRTIHLTNQFVIPGYRFDANSGRWVTNIGSVLDQPGWGGKPADGPVWPYGVGGGGYGPGYNHNWVGPQSGDYRYLALNTNVTDITAGHDTLEGGWPWFQFGLWNFSSNEPPISGVTVAGNPGVNINLLVSTNARSVQYGKDPTVHYPGGADGIYWPAPIADQYQHGFWTYPLDQDGQMHNTSMSRIPPYIAVGYVQFVGYA